MGRLIALTARKHNGQYYGKIGATVPRVIYVQEDNIIDHPPVNAGKPTKVTHRLNGEVNVYEVYEKAMQIESMRNPSSSDLLVKQHLATGLTANGTNQSTTLLLSKYFNEVTTITAGSAEAGLLPAATVGLVRVIVNNHATAAFKIFPAVGESINGQAANAVLSLAAGDRVHLTCPDAAGKWVAATDRGK